MKAADQDLRELTALCNALVDGTLSAADRTRLEQILTGSAAAREFYVQFMGLSASLCHYAAEAQAQVPAVAARPEPIWWQRPLWWGAAAAAAAAAVAAVVLWSGDVPQNATAPVATAAGPGVASNAAAAPIRIARGSAPVREVLAPQPPPPPAPVRVAQAPANPPPPDRVVPAPLIEEAPQIVAQVTGVENCRWAVPAAQLQPDEQLQAGQRLELAAGLVEISFDSGAQVTLEGPAVFELNSAWDGTLREGRLAAVVPAEAVGFRISNPAVDVVDLGTEFSMVAARDGATEVYVSKGRVQTLPHGGGGTVVPPAVPLKAGQAWTFGRRENAEINNPKVRSKAALRIPRIKPLHGRKHLGDFHGEFHFDQPREPNAGGGAPRAGGRFGRALQFDGHFAKQVPAPGLLHNPPHTIAFWARVPADAQLADAVVMAAWSTPDSGKVKGRPVQVGWNTDPAAGPVGALCTESTHGAVVGTTSLRDGRWHHVAIVVVPQHGQVHVKQYVDGSLEGEKMRPVRRHPHERPEALPGGVIYLGQRPGHDRAGAEHFRGELAELYIADRALPPEHIKELLATSPPGSPAPAASPAVPGKYSL